MNTVIQMKGHSPKKVVAELANAGPDAAPMSESALRRVAERIVALNRNSTSHAYELGECFADAKALVPEKRFGQWLKVFSDYTVRSAWNYISIHERLTAYREQLVTHAVMPTVLFELAKGEPAQIEAVIARMERGERIRVKDVKAALGIHRQQKEDASPLDTAGIAGLRKVAELKFETDAFQFVTILTKVLGKVDVALEPVAKGRAVKKSALQKAVVNDCRHAHDLINSVAASLRPDVIEHMNWRPAKLPAGSAWGRVQALLLQMGGVDTWPGRTNFVPWLQNEVMPLLRFVVHGDALGTEEAEADVTTDVEDTPDPDLIAFEQMPRLVQETVERALEVAPPENRDFLKSRVFFDPKPAQPSAA